MKMLTMTNLSTECLIQLTKLGYDATPFNQILKQNAKREMRLRLGKVTVADVLAAQPVTTNLFQAEGGMRDYKVTGVQTCALPIWRHPFNPFSRVHARRAVRNLPRGSHAAFDRICRAQAPGERRIRGDGAGGADLLRAARLELRRPGVRTVARREADRRVRRLPLRGRAFRLVRRDDPRAFPRGLRGRARNAREEIGRAHV